jgi:hypothetical protein
VRFRYGSDEIVSTWVAFMFVFSIFIYIKAAGTPPCESVI